jgi:hypothetical protein
MVITHPKEARARHPFRHLFVGAKPTNENRLRNLVQTKREHAIKCLCLTMGVSIDQTQLFGWRFALKQKFGISARSRHFRAIVSDVRVPETGKTSRFRIF